jgi:hypothetical protein
VSYTSETRALHQLQTSPPLLIMPLEIRKFLIFPKLHQISDLAVLTSEGCMYVVGSIHPLPIGETQRMSSEA